MSYTSNFMSAFKIREICGGDFILRRPMAYVPSVVRRTITVLEAVTSKLVALYSRRFGVNPGLSPLFLNTLLNLIRGAFSIRQVATTRP